jgi:hypothetical protein
MSKKFAGLTLLDIAYTHKDNELVKALVLEINRLRYYEAAYLADPENAAVDEIRVMEDGRMLKEVEEMNK